MARRRIETTSLLVADGQPLIAIPQEENGHAVVRYFTDDAAADAALSRSAIQEALAAIGSWSDLDWEDMERELYRIGHENPPTPPIENV